MDASPAGISLSASLSVPPNSEAAAISPVTLGGSAELETTSAPVVIDHETLRRAFVFVKTRQCSSYSFFHSNIRRRSCNLSAGSNLLRAPLDDYLSALCFIRKLTLALEAQSRTQLANRFPYSDLRCGLDFVSFLPCSIRVDYLAADVRSYSPSDNEL